MKEYYHKFRDADKVVSTMSKYISYFHPGDRVVDIGCGPGEFLQILKNNNIQAIGVEADPQMIEICISKGLEVIQEDILKYLENTTGMDGVVASHIIEHMDAHSVERIIEISHDILNPRGKLLIITPNPGSLNVVTRTFWLDTTHVRFYPLELLAEMAKNAGFRIIDSGGDPDTIPGISLGWLRDTLSKLVLRICGLSPLFRFVRAPDDIFIICAKD
jgi:O-antigen chain-terminating methyltransferase